MKISPAAIQRRRPPYLLAAVLGIGTGLLWRSGRLPLSPFVMKYGGDALWALLVFIGCGFVFAGASKLRVAFMALGFSWGIEFLQLYQAPWIDSLRATLPGRLVLGSTFNRPDLMAYAIGIAVGISGEFAYRRAKQGRPRSTD